jgi:hypothetical protein
MKGRQLVKDSGSAIYRRKISPDCKKPPKNDILLLLPAIPSGKE